jgi:hypothetical protein
MQAPIIHSLAVPTHVQLGELGRARRSRHNDAKKNWGECTLVVVETAHQRVTECALQSCAPQKLKIDAGANTSPTRRANPPEDSGSSSERAGASSNAAQSNAARAPECIVALCNTPPAVPPAQHRNRPSPEKRRLLGCYTFESGTRRRLSYHR